MGKLSSILLGTVSGVAVALFLTSEKGKRVTSQAQDFIEDLREDPEYAKEQALEKSKSLAQQATEASKETLNNFKEQLEEKVVVEDPEDGQEIIIEIEED